LKLQDNPGFESSWHWMEHCLRFRTIWYNNILCLFFSLLPILPGRSIHNFWVSRYLLCRQSASFPVQTVWR